MENYGIREDKRHRRIYDIAYISAEIKTIDDIDTEIRGIGEKAQNTPTQK